MNSNGGYALGRAGIAGVLASVLVDPYYEDSLTSDRFEARKLLHQSPDLFDSQFRRAFNSREHDA